MSNNIIKDGSGSGYRAKVNSKNQLETHAVSQTESAAATISGDSFLIPMGIRTFSTVDTEYPVLYINPNTAGKGFLIQRFFGSWNSSTSGIYRIYYGASAPTANNISFSVPNANSVSTKISSIDAQVWNGVGTGMTVSSYGTEALVTLVGQGINDIPAEGTILWGHNLSVLATIETPASAKGTLLVSGWEVDI